MGRATGCGPVQANRPADADAKVSLSQTNGWGRQVWFRPIQIYNLDYKVLET